MASLRIATSALAGPSTTQKVKASRPSRVAAFAPRVNVPKSRSVVIVRAGGPAREKWSTKGSTDEEKAAFDFGHDDWHHTYKPGKGGTPAELAAKSLELAGGPATTLQSGILLAAIAASFAALFLGGTVETSGNALVVILAVAAGAYCTIQIGTDYTKDFPGASPFMKDIIAKPLPGSDVKKEF